MLPAAISSLTVTVSPAYTVIDAVSVVAGATTAPDVSSLVPLIESVTWSPVTGLTHAFWSVSVVDLRVLVNVQVIGAGLSAMTTLSSYTPCWSEPPVHSSVVS